MAESTTDVCAALALLLEPSGTRDETWAEPFIYAPGVLYLWAGRDDEHRQAGDGSQDEERLTVVAGYAVSDLGERADKARQQGISVELDQKAHAYAEVLRANRRYPHGSDQANALWSNLEAVIHHNAIRSVGANAVRGFQIDIRLWRLVGP